MFDLQLKNLRKAFGLSQEELGKKTGYTLRQISGWERGETAISLLQALDMCEFFGCSLDQLAGRGEIEYRYVELPKNDGATITLTPEQVAAIRS